MPSALNANVNFDIPVIIVTTKQTHHISTITIHDQCETFMQNSCFDRLHFPRVLGLDSFWL
uniref:Uncharacterized protein n=1 Tax=Glossina morsitans morsitans TaxID=37546 RepID=A0A1B0G013_GLOMM